MRSYIYISLILLYLLSILCTYYFSKTVDQSQHFTGSLDGNVESNSESHTVHINKKFAPIRQKGTKVTAMNNTTDTYSR